MDATVVPRMDWFRTVAVQFAYMFRIIVFWFEFQKIIKNTKL